MSSFRPLPLQESCAALSIMALVIHSLLLLVIIISMNFTVTQLKVDHGMHDPSVVHKPSLIAIARNISQAMLAHNPWVPSTPIQVR